MCYKILYYFNKNRDDEKILLNGGVQESEKAGLNIQKTKIMASGPIPSWQIDGKTTETMRDFISLGSKINADGILEEEFPISPSYLDMHHSL